MKTTGRPCGFTEVRSALSMFLTCPLRQRSKSPRSVMPSKSRWVFTIRNVVEGVVRVRKTCQTMARSSHSHQSLSTLTVPPVPMGSTVAFLVEDVQAELLRLVIGTVLLAAILVLAVGAGERVAVPLFGKGPAQALPLRNVVVVLVPVAGDGRFLDAQDIHGVGGDRFGHGRHVVCPTACHPGADQPSGC